MNELWQYWSKWRNKWMYYEETPSRETIEKDRLFGHKPREVSKDVDKMLE